MMYDTVDRVGVAWIRDGTAVPEFERAAPLRTMLSWYARGSDCELMHAATVGRSDGSVLLVGGGGSGKSTCAIACLESPLSFIADDYVIVSPDHPDPYAHSKPPHAVPAGAVQPDRRRPPPGDHG